MYKISKGSQDVQNLHVRIWVFTLQGRGTGISNI